MDWIKAKGWLDPHEADALRELAKDRDVLEIGSYCGRSTLAMAQTARRVFALDWHRGDRDVGHEDTLSTFLANIATERDKIIPLVGKSEVIGPMLQGPFGLVFIDGSHRYEDVLADTKLAMRVCNGVIAWHDWEEKGVRRAIDECGFVAGESAGRNLMWVNVAGKE